MLYHLPKSLNNFFLLKTASSGLPSFKLNPWGVSSSLKHLSIQVGPFSFNRLSLSYAELSQEGAGRGMNKAIHYLVQLLYSCCEGAINEKNAWELGVISRPSRHPQGAARGGGRASIPYRHQITSHQRSAVGFRQEELNSKACSPQPWPLRLNLLLLNWFLSQN